MRALEELVNRQTKTAAVKESPQVTAAKERKEAAKAETARNDPLNPNPASKEPKPPTKEEKEADAKLQEAEAKANVAGEKAAKAQEEADKADERADKA